VIQLINALYTCLLELLPLVFSAFVLNCPSISIFRHIQYAIEVVFLTVYTKEWFKL